MPKLDEGLPVSSAAVERRSPCIVPALATTADSYPCLLQGLILMPSIEQMKFVC